MALNFGVMLFKKQICLRVVPVLETAFKNELAVQTVVVAIPRVQRLWENVPRSIFYLRFFFFLNLRLAVAH